MTSSSFFFIIKIIGSGDLVKDGKKIGKFLIIFLVFLVAFLFIGLGIYFVRLGSPNKIVGSVIDRADGLFRNYFSKSNFYTVSDNYTVESKVDFDLNSEYDTAMSKTDLEALKRVNYLKNLSLMETDILFQQNKETKQLFFELHEKIGAEELVGYKYFIDNSTEYYFLNNFLTTYVNNGSCNYFESFIEGGTSRENFEYLYDFVIESLKNNLKAEYFEEYDARLTIDGKEQEVKQVSLKVSDSFLRDIGNAILKDLKEDEKASKILTSIDKNFKKKKIKDSQTFLGDKESYTVNVYATKLFSKPVKFEVIYLDGTNKKTFSYEEGKAYYIENGGVVFDIDTLFMDDRYQLDIHNSSGSKLGVFKLEFDKDRLNLDFSLTKDNKKVDFVYGRKYVSVQKNKKYTREDKLAIKVIENKVSKLSGNIGIVSTVSRGAKIKEEVDNVVLASSLTPEQQANLDNKQRRVRERLEK